MSKRFESVNKDFFSYIEDNRSGLLYCTTNHNDMKDLANLLNKQAQRIAKLEEQLKNAIVPKFKVGDKAYAIIDTMFYTDVFPVDIVGVMLGYKVYDGQYTTHQNYVRVFATKEEAQERLQELKGENK